MPGAREVLQFILETDSTNAVKGFQQVEGAASKSLGATEKSATNLGSTMTKVGAVAVGAGLAMTAGLVGTVKAFEKSEAAANRLDTAVAGMGSKIDTKAIHALAFELQQVSTVTDDQVVAAARWGAVYGLTTRQLEQLLQVSVDLSAQTGQSLEKTTKALAKAAAGEGFVALTRMGLTFDETAYKADAFGTTVAEAMEVSAGAAAKQSDTFSGQLTRMGNNWQDVKEKIGAGANEVFEPMARAAGNLSEKVAALNPDLLKTVGHVAAVGSIGTTAFGGLAALGGQLVNIRDGFAGIGGLAEKAFGKMGLHLKDAEGNATGLGKALGGAGKALGAIGVGVALFEIGSAINEATENTTRFETAVNRLAKASTAREIGKQFQEMAEASEGAFDRFYDATLGRGIQKLDIGGTAIQVDDLSEALDKLKDTSPDELAAKLPVVAEALSKVTNKRGETKELAAHVKELQKWLDSQADASDKAAGANKKNAQSVEEAAKELKVWDEALKSTNGALGLYAIGANLAGEASKGFATATEAMDTDEQVTSALALGDAFHGVESSVANLPKSFDETKAALGGYNEKQTEALGALTSWGDAAKGQIKTLIESGATNEQVAAKAGTYRDALTGVMKQAGFTTAQIEEYQRILGLTDPQVETALKLSGDEKAKFQLQLYHNDLVGLTADQDTFIRALIAQGEYATAQKALDQFKNPTKAPIVPYVRTEDEQRARQQIQAIRDPSRSAPASTSVGVSATAMAPIPVAVQAPQITINLPAGSTPATTLAAIRRYQRLGGDMGGLLDTVAAIR